jgi:hypothetical protein
MLKWGDYQLSTRMIFFEQKNTSIFAVMRPSWFYNTGRFIRLSEELFRSNCKTKSNDFMGLVDLRLMGC